LKAGDDIDLIVRECNRETRLQFDAVILALIGAGTEDIDNKEHAIGAVMEDGTTYINE
jgi:hypothetical protein